VTDTTKVLAVSLFMGIQTLTVVADTTDAQV